MEPAKRSTADKLVLFIAEGFGSGRMPFAPGTFGTMVGFGWIYLLLLPRNLPLYLAGIVVGFFAAVYIGQRAEEILNKHDPNSIVIDEIAAMPLAFLPAVLMSKTSGSIFGATIHPGDFLGGKLILLPMLTFVLFRIFDVLKPLGIDKVQEAPGGWGLVLDDYLAALATAVVLYLLILISG
jgi:phosphatidylglycerophosphatase A